MNRARLAWIPGALLVVALSCAGPAPEIDTAGMEPPVRELIRERTDAVNASPDARSWGELGDALFAHGLRADAASCYARAVELADDPFEWLYLQALASKPDEGHELLKRAIQLRPDSALVELRAALLLQDEGRHEEAAGAFERALDLDPVLQRAHRGLGQEALALGRPETAIEPLERAVTLLDTDAAGWSALAQAYAALGRADEARRAAGRASTGREVPGFDDAIWREHVEDSGVSSSRRYNRALRALSENDAEAAREHVEAILASRPDDADAHYLLGLIEGRGGDLESARRHFERALECDPAHGRSLRELASLAEREGRLDEALSHNRTAHELTPHDPSIVLAIARVQHRLGDLNGVTEALEKLVALQPDNVSYLLDLGDLDMHRRRWADAERRFREATRRAPGLADAHYRLGLVLEATSRLDLAADAYRRAAALDPSSPATTKLRMR